MKKIIALIILSFSTSIISMQRTYSINRKKLHEIVNIEVAEIDLTILKLQEKAKRKSDLILRKAEMYQLAASKKDITYYKKDAEISLEKAKKLLKNMNKLFTTKINLEALKMQYPI